MAISQADALAILRGRDELSAVLREVQRALAALEKKGSEDLGPGRFRSFCDPNKIITIAEPKEPVSQ